MAIRFILSKGGNYMAKKRKPIRVVLTSGDKELMSFKASDFDNFDEINLTLNSLVNVIVGTVMAASVHALAEASDNGTTNDISFASNKVFDLVAKLTREKIDSAIDHFSKLNKDSDAMKGGDA
jgi:hypothetical protein